ncbi:MAG: hypothetical protein ABH832_02225 [bacterium]
MNKISSNNGKKSQFWQKSLNLISQCPTCGLKYGKKATRQFIDTNESTYLAHITCNNCSTCFLALIMEVGHGLSAIGMVTDLNFEDVKRLNHTQPIAMDEVLEGYELAESALFIEKISI